jgi:MFS family permease
VLVLPLGLGVVAGVFGLSRFGRSIPRRRAAEAGLVIFGSLAIAIGIVAAVGSRLDVPVVPVVVALAFIAGAAYATTTVSAQTALFENMDAAVRGRVFGVLASIVSASSLLPILVAGPLADQTSGVFVIALAACGVLVVAGWSALAFGPRPDGRSG